MCLDNFQRRVLQKQKHKGGGWKRKGIPGTENTKAGASGVGFFSSGGSLNERIGCARGYSFTLISSPLPTLFCLLKFARMFIMAVSVEVRASCSGLRDRSGVVHSGKAREVFRAVDSYSNFVESFGNVDSSFSSLI